MEAKAQQASRNNHEKRLDRGAWIDAAIDLLVTSSIDDVSVVPLAKKLRVTKGSFYWHFKDRAELLQAMLTTWRQRVFDDVIARLEEKESDPRRRIKQLMELPHSSKRAHRTAMIELAIREWARRDSMAAEAVAEVDKHRLRYTIGLYRSLGMDEDMANAKAFLLYSCNLGEALITTQESGSKKKARRMLVYSKLLDIIDT